MSSDTAWIIIDEIIHLMNIKGEFARSIDLETSIEAIHVDNKKSTIYWFTNSDKTTRKISMHTSRAEVVKRSCDI